MGGFVSRFPEKTGDIEVVRDFDEFFPLDLCDPITSRLISYILLIEFLYLVSFLSLSKGFAFESPIQQRSSDWKINTKASFP